MLVSFLNTDLLGGLSKEDLMGGVEDLLQTVTVALFKLTSLYLN
jgi:hypothetical protein